MMQFKIALLNVIRNYRRSLITLVAIQFGVASLIIFGGYISAMHEGHREGIIHSQLGHIQIYKKGFNDYGSSEPEAYLLSPELQNKVQTAVDSIQQVVLATPRLNFSGLITNGRHSIAVVGAGIDADKEAMLSSSINIIKGESLFPENTSGGLLGAGLVKALNVNVGDYLTLLASTSDGAMNAVDVELTGVLSTGVRDLDNILIRLNLNHVQDLMYTQDVTRLVLMLDETEHTQPVLKQLEKIFTDQELDLELKTWDELAMLYNEVVAMYDSIFFFIKLIVLFIVALSISNTMLMSVMERTNEIGTIRAIGATRSGVVFMVMTEAGILGVIGCLAGIATGYILAETITALQFMMPTPPGATQTYPVRVFFETGIILETAALGLVMAVVSSIYPAVKASRLQITQALRFA